MSKRNKKNISYIFTQRPVKTSYSGALSATNVSLIINLKYCLSKFDSHGCGLYGFAIFCICLILTKSVMVCLWSPDRKFDTVSGELITFHTRHIAYHFLLYPVLGNRSFSWWRHFTTTTFLRAIAYRETKGVECAKKTPHTGAKPHKGRP